MMVTDSVCGKIRGSSKRKRNASFTNIIQLILYLGIRGCGGDDCLRNNNRAARVEWQSPERGSGGNSSGRGRRALLRQLHVPGLRTAAESKRYTPTTAEFNHTMKQSLQAFLLLPVPKENRRTKLRFPPSDCTATHRPFLKVDQLLPYIKRPTSQLALDILQCPLVFTSLTWRSTSGFHEKKEKQSTGAFSFSLLRVPLLI